MFLALYIAALTILYVSLFPTTWSFNNDVPLTAFIAGFMLCLDVGEKEGK